MCSVLHGGARGTARLLFGVSGSQRGTRVGRDFLPPDSSITWKSQEPWLRSKLTACSRLPYSPPRGLRCLGSWCGSAPPLPRALPCPCLTPSSAPQIVSSASTDLQDYTYYFVPAPWLSVKLLRLLQCYPPPGTAANPARTGP